MLSELAICRRCFCAVLYQRMRNESQRPSKKGAFVPFVRQPKPKIPFLVIPWSFFTPKPHRNTFSASWAICGCSVCPSKTVFYLVHLIWCIWSFPHARSMYVPLVLFFFFYPLIFFSMRGACPSHVYLVISLLRNNLITTMCTLIGELKRVTLFVFLLLLLLFFAFFLFFKQQLCYFIFA